MDSPKTRLLKTKNASAIAAWFAHPDFLMACETALLQWIYDQGQATDLADATRRHFKLEGARSFMLELLTIATPPTTKKTVAPKDNLEP